MSDVVFIVIDVMTRKGPAIVTVALREVQTADVEMPSGVITVAEMAVGCAYYAPTDNHPYDAVRGETIALGRCLSTREGTEQSWNASWWQDVDGDRDAELLMVAEHIAVDHGVHSATPSWVKGARVTSAAGMVSV